MLNNTQLSKQAYKTIHEVFAPQNEETVLFNVSLMTSLAKRDEYQTECQFFKDKHGMKFQEFDKAIHHKDNQENFEKEEDYMDWEFAEEALNYWNQKIKLLQNYA